MPFRKLVFVRFYPLYSKWIQKIHPLRQRIKSFYVCALMGSITRRFFYPSSKNCIHIVSCLFTIEFVMPVRFFYTLCCCFGSCLFLFFVVVVVVVCYRNNSSRYKRITLHIGFSPFGHFHSFTSTTLIHIQCAVQNNWKYK